MAVISGESVIKVGNSAVVPNLACASQIVRTPSAVGASFSSTPPPPLTWASTKPGASTPPCKRCTGRSLGTTASGTTSRMRVPSTITACCARRLVPSKISAPAIANRVITRFP